MALVAISLLTVVRSTLAVLSSHRSLVEALTSFGPRYAPAGN